MRRGDKIYIVAALALQTHHHRGKLALVCFNPLPQVADLVILAEDTEQAAVGQKYCPRAAGADQGAFFAEMGGIAGNYSPGPGAADPFFIGEPVNLALPRTDTAR